MDGWLDELSSLLLLVHVLLRRPQLHLPHACGELEGADALADVLLLGREVDKHESLAAFLQGVLQQEGQRGVAVGHVTGVLAARGDNGACVYINT